MFRQGINYFIIFSERYFLLFSPNKSSSILNYFLIMCILIFHFPHFSPCEHIVYDLSAFYDFYKLSVFSQKQLKIATKIFFWKILLQLTWSSFIVLFYIANVDNCSRKVTISFCFYLRLTINCLAYELCNMQTFLPFNLEHWPPPRILFVHFPYDSRELANQYYIKT